MNEGINIFVVCHKPTCVLKNSLLTPIQVGAAIAKEHFPDMIYDDSGDNISKKNALYCELTAQYWAWKNVRSEYYGFFHYRRYLSFEKAYSIDGSGRIVAPKRPCPYTEFDDIRDDLTGYHLEENFMRQMIVQYDLLTVLREKINTTVYKQYCQYHSQDALDKVLAILKKKYPDYTEAAGEYLNSKEIYYLNMFIMKRPLFMEYASWLFDILWTYEREMEASGVKLEDRLMGYLAERLFGIFYTFQRKRGAVCAELPYLKFYNTELMDSKGVNDEEKKNIRIFRLRPTKIEIKMDMRKFNKIFPAGTRRRILIRNIFLR